MWFLYWLRMQRLRFYMKTTFLESDNENDAENQKMRKSAALIDAKAAFAGNSNNESNAGHNLYNANDPIIGRGSGSGVMGSHPAKRHDDVYGKDVNGIGLSPFEPNFGEGTQNNTTEGDHALAWRDRLFETEEWVGDLGVNDYPEIWDSEEGEWITQSMMDERVANKKFDDENNARIELWEQREIEANEQRENEAAALKTLLDHENKWVTKFRSTYNNGVEMYFAIIDHRENNKRAREAGMVRNPRWKKGCHDQPYHIPRGALLSKADIRVCNPHRGKCECTKPILQRVRRMPWGGYDKGDIAKRHGFGRWMNLVCTTHSDKKKACRNQKWWGVKKVQTKIPSLTQKVKVADAWDSVIPDEPKANTPKAETKPEQRVEVQSSRIRVVEW